MFYAVSSLTVHNHFLDAVAYRKHTVYIQSIEKIIFGHINKTLDRVTYNRSHSLPLIKIKLILSLSFVIVQRHV